MPEPELSVIVISFNPPPLLARCLDALAPQIRPGESELLVVGRELDSGQLATRHPQAQFIVAPPEENVPHMRRRGLAAGRGYLVALLEDDCVVSADWCASIIEAHRATAHPAVGGAIEPDDYPDLLSWAVYFCEYGRFMAPFAGPVAMLPGNNVSYKRAELPPLAEMADGFQEVFLHWHWRAAGRTLLADPRLAVRNVNRWDQAHVTRVPYHHGRAFAATRAEGWTNGRRLLRAVTVPLLPILQLGRMISEVAGRRRHLLKFLLATPWIILFHSSWAAGECIGYLRGPGDSKAHWR